jgi:NAD+ synthase (glutamine-hydrolysing)
LARFRNAQGGHSSIPESTLKRPPTAELRANQKDQDSLPPYDLLDKFLELYVEKDLSIRQIVKRGIPEKVALRTASLVDGNEYKRRQSPPGVKITPKAFGRDRRMPITNRFKQ